MRRPTLFLAFWLLGSLVLAFIVVPLLSLVAAPGLTGLLRAAAMPDVRAAIALSLGAAFVAALFAAAFGVPLAYVLARSAFSGKGVVEAVVDLPLTVPHTVAGIALLLAFGREGVLGEPAAAWFGLRFWGTFAGIVVAMLFVSLPYAVNAARIGFEEAIVDDFKGINDSCGHVIGDQLLVGIARRLELVTRASDTICRLGSDQFLYLAEGMDSPEQAEEVAARLLEVLIEPFTFSGLVIEQHATIGLVVCEGENASTSGCIQEADVALYEAKKNRKGGYLPFSAKMHEEALKRFSLIQELRQALHGGELAMHYQPIVNLVTNEVLGFEALMRWHHPVQGWIPPDVFIPLAEQSELIIDLGAFALNEALRAASTWRWANASSAPPYVSVNFSAHQFHDRGLIEGIESALERHGVPPERLIVEITESVALHDAAET